MLTSFTIRPDPKRDEYYEVLVFGSKKSMYRYYSCNGGKRTERDFLAITENITRYNGGVLFKSYLGRILITRDMCRAGAVAHECLHAAIFYADERVGRKDYGSDGEDHEWLAWILGHLVSEFWLKYWDWTQSKKK